MWNQLVILFIMLSAVLGVTAVVSIIYLAFNIKYTKSRKIPPHNH